MSSQATEQPPIVIEPPRGLPSLGLGELLRYRELVWFLAWRDVKVRYRQAMLGVLWVLIQPLGAMAIFSVVFGRLARMPSDGAPYPLFAYAALLPWQLFARALTDASDSLVVNKNLITKVYFPRLTVPLATILAGLLDFTIALIGFLGLLVAWRVSLTLRLLLLPALALLAAAIALGAGLWLSALNVRFRDVRYTIPFLTQVGLFATPVVYPESLVPERWRAVFALNPMVGVIGSFRWALLGTEAPGAATLAVSLASAVVLLATGALYFRATEASFADTV